VFHLEVDDIDYAALAHVACPKQIRENQFHQPNPRSILELMIPWPQGRLGPIILLPLINPRQSVASVFIRVLVFNP
jgi:hypothetical protein